MIVVKKITVKYSAEEDRLCFVAEAPHGESLLLWITARLAVRLVECLVRKLMPSESSLPKTTSARVKQQALQEWEQSAAHLTQKPTREVKVQTGSRHVLVRSVNVSDVGQGFGLVFCWPPDEGAQMIFTAVEMRLFLQIVYSLFKQAGWPMQVWPEWYNQQQAPSKKSQKRFLH